MSTSRQLKTPSNYTSALPLSSPISTFWGSIRLDYNPSNDTFQQENPTLGVGYDQWTSSRYLGHEGEKLAGGVVEARNRVSLWYVSPSW